MSRRLFTSARVFPVLMVISLAVALLPDHLLGWTSVPAEIISLPFGPFGDGLNRAGDWLRQPRSAPTRISDEELAHLQQEREDFERLYHIEHDRNAELQARISQLESGVEQVPGTHVDRKSAAVVIRPPGEPFGRVLLNRGASHGVTVPAVAVYFGQILGRLTDVTNVQCTLLPAANRENKWITAVLKPRDKPAAPLETLPQIQFQAVGDGTFAADIDKSYLVSAGDLAVLHDSSWPRAAQGSRLGIVESVQVKDSDPLRNVVIVRPQHQVAQVTYVMLLMDVQDAGEGSSSDGGPR